MRATGGGVLDAELAALANVALVVHVLLVVDVLVVTGDCVTRKQLATRLIRLGMLPWSEKMARAEQSLLGMGPVTGPRSSVLG